MLSEGLDAKTKRKCQVVSPSLAQSPDKGADSEGMDGSPPPFALERFRDKGRRCPTHHLPSSPLRKQHTY